MKTDKKQLLMFIVPSTLGVLLFMIPILVNDTWTIAVKVLADIINGVVSSELPFFCAVLLTISAVMACLALTKPAFIMERPRLMDCFSCTPVWTVIRVLGCIFAWITLLEFVGALLTKYMRPSFPPPSRRFPSPSVW